MARQIARTYPRLPPAPRATNQPVEFTLVSPPVQRQGYVEQLHHTYTTRTRSARGAAPARLRAAARTRRSA
ncbi:MAG: hypothetical protein ACKVS8_03355 [Phycisphaerales bacterium]